MKKTVIFDLDGLLINSEIISYELYRDLLEKYHHPFSLEEYIHDYSGKTGVGNMENLIAIYDLPITLEEGLSFADAKEKEYFQRGVELKPGATELLVYLKKENYKIMLATSSTRDRAIDVLSQHGIEGDFDYMVFGTEVKRGKPYPDIFIMAQECAGETADSCLVLEDSEAGIQAAHSAGIDVICIPDMKTPAEEFVKMTASVLPSLYDVIPWLESLHGKREL